MRPPPGLLAYRCRQSNQLTNAVKLGAGVDDGTAINCSWGRCVPGIAEVLEATRRVAVAVLGRGDAAHGDLLERDAEGKP